MSNIAYILGHALSAVSRGITPLDLTRLDNGTLDELGYDRSTAQRARFQPLRMGEPGATNAARLGLNGR